VTRLLLGALLVVLVAACSGNDNGGATPTPGSGGSASAGFTVAPGATAEPGATPAPRELTGLSSDPQQATVTPHPLEQPPATKFAGWDGTSVVLYDTVTGKETRFGKGMISAPAFGGNSFVYTSEGEVWLVDLASMQKRSLGKGLVAYFLGDKTVVINPGDNNFVAVNLDTGGTAPLLQITDPLLKSMATQRWGGAFRAQWLDGRYAIRLASTPDVACAQGSSDRPLCEAQASEDWEVEDVQTGEVLYRFRANQAAPAGPGEIVVATSPTCVAEDGTAIGCFELLDKIEKDNPEATAQGSTNIFIVNLATGESTFVATATYNVTARSWPMAWPLVANESYVAWTESYCGNPSGLTRILDRSTGQITELNVSAWLTLRAGKLGLGEFGARSILDPKTFQFLTVLPQLGDVSWSGDLRYAAVGGAFGHGGICG
jgi:hypothetical protein